MMLAVFEANHRQRGHNMLPALFSRKAGQQQRKLDVLEGAQNGDQIVQLKDESDVTGPPFGQLLLVELGYVFAVDHHAAGVGLVDAGDQVEQGRLA
jgi:hypothetical protein